MVLEMFIRLGRMPGVVPERERMERYSNSFSAILRRGVFLDLAGSGSGGCGREFFG